jgi:hypothetical protein
MIYERDQVAGYRACAGRIAAAVDALRLPSDMGTGTDAQLAAFHLMATPPADDLSRAFAGRRALDALRAAAAEPGFVDLLTYDGPPGGAAPPAGAEPPSEIALLLLAMRVAAEGLGERELATADAEMRAALAALGASGAMARLYLYARRAHHLAELARLGRELLAAATSDVGRG